VVAKRHGISEQAIYTWRKRFGGFQANDVRRLKQPEAENARLKKLVAERDLVPWSPTVVVVRCGSK
jgi:putative transposase